jgi:hypothetical protein
MYKYTPKRWGGEERSLMLGGSGSELHSFSREMGRGRG